MFWDGVERVSRFPPVHRTERSPLPTWRPLPTLGTLSLPGDVTLCVLPCTFLASPDHRPPWGPSFLPSWGVTFTPAAPFVSAYWISPIVSSEVHRPPGAPLLRSPQLHCSHRALSPLHSAPALPQTPQRPESSAAPQPAFTFSPTLRCSLNPGEKLEQDPPSLPVQSWSLLSSLLSLTSRERFN